MLGFEFTRLGQDVSRRVSRPNKWIIQTFSLLATNSFKPTRSFTNDVWGKVNSQSLALTTWTFEFLGIAHIVKARKSCWDPKTSSDRTCLWKLHDGQTTQGKNSKGKFNYVNKEEWINSLWPMWPIFRGISWRVQIHCGFYWWFQ